MFEVVVVTMKKLEKSRRWSQPKANSSDCLGNIVPSICSCQLNPKKTGTYQIQTLNFKPYWAKTNIHIVHQRAFGRIYLVLFVGAHSVVRCHHLTQTVFERSLRHQSRWLSLHVHCGPQICCDVDGAWRLFLRCHVPQFLESCFRMKN